MWKKIAVAGVVSAAILGTGAAALADTSTSTPTPSSTPTAAGTSTPKTGHLRAKGVLARIEHGEWVSQGKSGDVTHDAVGGTVSAVSATSITVKASDGYSEAFTVDATTKIHVKGTKPATIANVKVGDRAVVAGIKSGTTVTATQVVDAGTR
jgi:hypothetical protein